MEQDRALKNKKYRLFMLETEEDLGLTHRSKSGSDDLETGVPRLKVVLVGPGKRKTIRMNF